MLLFDVLKSGVVPEELMSVPLLYVPVPFVVSSLIHCGSEFECGVLATEGFLSKKLSSVVWDSFYLQQDVSSFTVFSLNDLLMNESVFCSVCVQYAPLCFRKWVRSTSIVNFLNDTVFPLNTINSNSNFSSSFGGVVPFEAFTVLSHLRYYGNLLEDNVSYSKFVKKVTVDFESLMVKSHPVVDRGFVVRRLLADVFVKSMVTGSLSVLRRDVSLFPSTVNNQAYHDLLNNNHNSDFYVIFSCEFFMRRFHLLDWGAVNDDVLNALSLSFLNPVVRYDDLMVWCYQDFMLLMSLFSFETLQEHWVNFNVKRTVVLNVPSVTQLEVMVGLFDVFNPVLDSFEKVFLVSETI